MPALEEVPPWAALLTGLAAEAHIPAYLLRPEVRLARLVADAGEPALLALILAIEAHLPEPFPEELLDQVETLEELLAFAETKRSRASWAAGASAASW